MSTKKLTGIVIDPIRKTIESKQLDDDTILDQIYATIDCIVITAPCALSNIDYLYVDEEASYNGTDTSILFCLDNAPDKIYAGKALILGDTGDDVCSTTLSVEDVKERITFKKNCKLKYHNKTGPKIKRSTKEAIWIIAGTILLLFYPLLPQWMRFGNFAGFSGLWYPICVFAIVVSQIIRSK